MTLHDYKQSRLYRLQQHKQKALDVMTAILAAFIFIVVGIVVCPTIQTATSTTPNPEFEAYCHELLHN